jgi:hypothetical protein
VPPLTQNQLDTYEYKLRKRGFKRDDPYLYECPDCAKKAIATYAILSRTGGRDIRLCLECGTARSYRSGAGMGDRVEDPTFDLDAFLR